MPTDRRTFLRLGALTVIGAACATATPTTDPTPAAPPPPDPPSPSLDPSLPGPDQGRALAWERLSPAGATPPPRRDHTFTGAGDRAYLFGGRAGDERADLWEYRADTDRWRRIDAEGPSPRFGHNAEFIDGRLIVFGGQAGSDLFNDAWAFEPGAGWTELRPSGSTPGIRYGAGSIATGNAMVVSHGFNFQGRFDDTRRLNPSAPRWSNASPAGRRPRERCLHRCAPVGSRMMLFGGQSTGAPYLDDTWLLDLEADRWREIGGKRPPARNLNLLQAAGSDVWLFGGFSSAGPRDDTWRFRKGAWSKTNPEGPTPPARGGVEGAAMADGSILMFGGSDGDAELDDLWRLTTS